MKIFFFHTQNSGVGMWRMLHPAKWLNKLGLAEVKTLPFYWRTHGFPSWKEYEKDRKDKGIEPSQADFEKKIAKIPKDPPIEKIHELCNWADLIVVMRRDTQDHVAMMQSMREYMNKPVVFETDDFVHYVPPYNPGARYYAPGSPQSDIWSSQQFQVANFVQVTTPGLKKLYNQLSDKITVMPNMIDPEYWLDSFDPPKEHPGEIRIGWTGANAHWQDLRILRTAIHKVLDKYPNVNFHFIGQLPDWWYDLKKSGRVINHKFKNLLYYPKYLHSLGFDIGVAPLRDNLFNRGKSNIRWIEYSLNQTAVVASPVWAYTNDPYSVIKDKKNVLFAKEENDWVKALSKLIEDTAFRKKIANQAYSDVMEFYNLETGVHKWAEAYEKMLS